MWADYLHHITLHFPIVLTMTMAVVGLYALRTKSEDLIPLLRWGGHATLAFTAMAVVSGLVAGGISGGPETLQHHRYLGVTAFIVIALAAFSYEYGIRSQTTEWRSFALCLWWVASFAVIGAGHWGGWGAHTDVIPF